MRFFSTGKRPAHLGPFPDERLPRTDRVDLSGVPPFTPVEFGGASGGGNLSGSMAPYIAMLDTIRDGVPNEHRAEIPGDPAERSRHVRGAGYFYDAGMVATCEVPVESRLERPVRNADIDALAAELAVRQVKTLASGIDAIMAELREAVARPSAGIERHTHAVVFLYEYPRDPSKAEPGGEWIAGTNAQRAALRAAETAAVLANYFRLLGYPALAHTATTTDVNLNVLAVASGLTTVVEDDAGTRIENPFVGRHFGMAAITTTMALAPDRPLAPGAAAAGLRWRMGFGTVKRRGTARPYAKRRFVDGELPFEKIKRVKHPTTLIDEARIPRVPKRTDMFPRAQFGDFGPRIQKESIGGKMMAKSALGWAPRQALGACILLQDGDVAPEIDDSARDPTGNAHNLKAALHFLGVDAVGLSRCPDWVYYSHDSRGEPIVPYHKNAITTMIDQGRDSMEGSSGDDWLSSAQSMRAYLRNSILGGVVAARIRSLGYSARVHTVVDGEVLQAPLSLISGMGEVSRIGEVILHPLLGPRLKTGVVTTDMPFDHDDPIDFGLQAFCGQCNKCARECPAGAITAGPKRMFNGYEIWKSDSEKCLNYRLTNAGGSMCGRCMKTCPWNLEGLFAEKPFRWAASNVPMLARPLARLDDRLGHGAINAVKKWWWDLERNARGRFVAAGKSNRRELQTDLDLKFEDQTLAVYPAPLAPHPWPFPFPADREAGIEAYRSMLSPREYRDRIAKGETGGLAHEYAAGTGDPPVLRLVVARVEKMSAEVTKYEFRDPAGSPLPQWRAGAHLDVVVAPEYLRQFSLCGDPHDRTRYQIGVLREDGGRGGSALLHRIFNEGREVFVSRPVNHFPLEESAARTLLLAGGIGVTPLIAMAHRLHRIGSNFDFHYSAASRDVAGFLEDLERFDWAGNVHLHFSDEGTRADPESLLREYRQGWHLYVCGPDRYMQCVLETAASSGWSGDALHREYFSAPELPEYVNRDFTLRLARTGRDVLVRAAQSATEALAEASIHVDTKCSDGICGVCKCRVLSGEVEHRDFVLSNADRRHEMILCQSRAREPEGVLEIDL